jgi:carboxylesterase type B
MMDAFEHNFEKYLNPVNLHFIQRINVTPIDLKHYYYGNEKMCLKNIDKFIDYCTDMHFLEGIHRIISLQVKNNLTPTYFYRFTYDKEVSIMKSFINSTLPG